MVKLPSLNNIFYSQPQMWYCFHLFQSSLIYFKNIYYVFITKVSVMSFIVLMSYFILIYFKLFWVINRSVSNISLNSLNSANSLVGYLLSPYIQKDLSEQWHFCYSSHFYLPCLGSNIQNVLNKNNNKEIPYFRLMIFVLEFCQ